LTELRAQNAAAQEGGDAAAFINQGLGSGNDEPVVVSPLDKDKFLQGVFTRVDANKDGTIDGSNGTVTHEGDPTKNPELKTYPNTGTVDRDQNSGLNHSNVLRGMRTGVQRTGLTGNLQMTEGAGLYERLTGQWYRDRRFFLAQTGGDEAMASKLMLQWKTIAEGMTGRENRAERNDARRVFMTVANAYNKGEEIPPSVASGYQHFPRIQEAMRALFPDAVQDGELLAPAPLLTGVKNLGTTLTVPRLELAATPLLAVGPKTGTERGPNRPTLASVLVGHAVRQYPDVPFVAGMSGDESVKNGKPEDAVKSYTFAIENGEDSSDLRYRRAYSLAAMGDYEGAQADAAEALRMDPSNGKALALLKLSEQQTSGLQMNTEEPAFDAKRLLAMGPGGAGGTGRGGWGGGFPGSSKSAAEMAKAANMAAKASHPILQSQKLTKEAYTAMRVGDFETAFKKAEQALALDPRNPQAYNARATAHLRLKEFPPAVKEASTGLGFAPKNVPLLNTRAMAYNRMGEYGKAHSDASAAIALEKRGAFGYYNRAFAGAGLGRVPESKLDLKRAASLNKQFEPAAAQAARISDEDMLLALFDSTLPAAQEAPKPRKPSGPLPLWPLVGLGGVLVGLAAVLVFRRKDSPVTRVRGAAEPWEDAAAENGFWEHYEVVRELGAGGFGLVYEAVDKRLDRKVAVKRLRDEIRLDRRERERFLTEARTVAKMRHPNIVEIFSIEEDGDDAYLVFEFVEGKTLSDRIQEKGRLSLPEAKDLFRSVCQALEYAHGRNIIHRDLKPANIMVDVDGTVKVMDFGGARQVSDAAGGGSMTMTVFGTPAYMAPEQEQGEVRRESDVYALGVCLYEALSGRLPFDGTPAAMLLSKMEGKWKPLDAPAAGLPERVTELMRKALEPDPEKRIKTPREFYAELEALAPTLSRSGREGD